MCVDTNIILLFTAKKVERKNNRFDHTVVFVSDLSEPVDREGTDDYEMSR